MNKETFEAYLKLENIVELMTNINYKYKEKETIKKYQKELVTKMTEFKEILRIQKNGLNSLREKRQVLYMQITNIDSLNDKSFSEKRNILYDEYKKYTRELYDNTQNYNKLAASFNGLNSELRHTEVGFVTKEKEISERETLGKYIYDYCIKEPKYNKIIDVMKKMDDNNIFIKTTEKQKSNKVNNLTRTIKSNEDEPCFFDESRYQKGYEWLTPENAKNIGKIK